MEQCEKILPAKVIKRFFLQTLSLLSFLLVINEIRKTASITHKDDEGPLKKWRRRADLNRWPYGFANRSIGPLWHVSS